MLPARLLGSVLVVELLAVVLLVVDGVRGGAGQFSRSSLAVLAALAVVGVLHTEIALRVERARRRVTPSPHIDLSSVWTFAAALLLSPLLAAAVVAVVYLHLLARVWRPTRQPVYRWAFTTCTVVLAVHGRERCVVLRPRRRHRVRLGRRAGRRRGRAAVLHSRQHVPRRRRDRAQRAGPDVPRGAGPG